MSADPLTLTLLGAGLGFTKAGKKQLKKLGDPFKAPDINIPGVPTIDEAKQNRDEVDRIRRRKGVLANVFGGAGNASPTVGTATLLGQ